MKILTIKEQPKDTKESEDVPVSYYLIINHPTLPFRHASGNARIGCGQLVIVCTDFD